MNLKDQCISFELAKKLKELNVNQQSLFCYQPIKDSPPSVWPRRYNLDEFVHPSIDERIAAFTSAELGEFLPKEIIYKDQYYYLTECLTNDAERWIVFYRNAFSSLEDAEANDKNEANARAKMLIHLIENGLYKND